MKHRPTELFVYGTLKHDQPEHARFCRGVTGWRRARVSGRLFRLREGYLILFCPESRLLLEASPHARADEVRREALARRYAEAGREPGPQADAVASEPSVGGEVLCFADAEEAWPSLDEWEGFVPGQGGVYRRVVTPVEILDDEGRPCERRFVWVYATSRVPPGAEPVSP